LSLSSVLSSGLSSEELVSKLAVKWIDLCRYSWVSAAEIAYFQVMLDLNGDERVTLREFTDAVVECAECGRDAATSAGAPGVPEVGALYKLNPVDS
jgi:hypothetical protein